MHVQEPERCSFLASSGEEDFGHLRRIIRASLYQRHRLLGHARDEGGENVCAFNPLILAFVRAGSPSGNLVHKFKTCGSGTCARPLFIVLWRGCKEVFF